jgi:hypothetical protein
MDDISDAMPEPEPEPEPEPVDDAAEQRALIQQLLEKREELMRMQVAQPPFKPPPLKPLPPTLRARARS